MVSHVPSPLLAVMLVTSSSRGPTLSFRYPRRPVLEKRYSKVKYLVAAEDDQAALGRDGLDADEMDEEQDEAASSVLSEDEEDESASSEGGSSSGAEDAGDGATMDYAASEHDFVADVASSAGGTASAAAAAAAHDQAYIKSKRQRAYQQYLGYDCDILASLLTPKRELCHQKFELVIDDLAFVGHPVCVDSEGKWDPEAEQDMRGRGRAARADSTGTSAVPVADDGKPSQISVAASLTLFHFVLVLDRPDPSPDMPALDLTSWLQIFYDNIAFKMTAALFAEEVRCGYVSKECEKINTLRERCMDDGQSYGSYLTHASHISSLARSLQQLYSSISLSNNAFVTVNESIDAHLQLPPMLHDPKRMMRIADIETPIDINDPMFNAEKALHNAEDLIYFSNTRTTGPFLLPWKTLLLLHNTSDEDHGRGEDEDDQDGSDFATPTADKGIEVWSRKFTSLLKPTLEGMPTLADTADLLDWSLEDDIYPMVRHLIYYREARVIDVPRVQNYYAVSPLFDLVDLPRLSTSWSVRFPGLLPLPAFLALLSSALRPFNTQIKRRDQRQMCLDALIWLLRYEIIIQMHVRLRLIANEACKLRAARARSQERQRIKMKRAKIAQRQARLVQRQKREYERQQQKQQQQPTSQSKEERQRETRSSDRRSIESLNDFSQSAPASGQAVPAEEAPDSHTLSRGRQSRLRSGSTYTSTEAVQSNINPSALSVTRPAVSKPDDERLPRLGRTPLEGGGSSQRSKIEEELKFERRPVLRSRSPSGALALASFGDTSLGSGMTPGSLANRAGSGSRPNTPRGRRKFFNHSRDSSNAGTSVAVAPDTPVASLIAPSTTAKAAAGAASDFPSSVPSGSAAGAARAVSVENRRRRSPSVARLRVTGFGDDEEVYVEGQTVHAVEGKSHDGRSGAQWHEEMRRLSLVGEEKETERTIPAKEDDSQRREKDVKRIEEGGKGASASKVSEGAATGKSVEDEGEKEAQDGESDLEDEDEDDDEEPFIDIDIDFDVWETQPMATVIPEPSRATGDENEWIAAMVEGRDAWLVERLYKLLPFLNGKHTVDEIVYRLEWRRKELRAVLNAFRDDILTFVHP